MTEENKQQPNIPENPSVAGVIRRGNEIYERKKAEIETPENAGRYVSIEVESERLFFANTRDEAVVEARKLFPLPIILFVKRIVGVDRVSRQLHSQQRHARVF